MNKKTYLNIPQPCHENWNEMTPQQQGRFCNSCSQSVIDFSKMTDKLILDIISKTSGSTCGRFSASQLQRSMHPTKAADHSRKLLLNILIPAFTLTLLNKTNAQEKMAFVQPVINNAPAITLQKKDVSIVPIDSILPKLINGQTSQKNQITSEPIIECAVDQSILMGKIAVVQNVTLIDTVKSFIQKSFGGQMFTVIPNPAKSGGSVRLIFKKTGVYVVDLYDNAGKLYVQNKFTTSKINQVIVFNIPPGIARGMFYLKAMNPSTKTSYTEKMVIY